MVAPGQWGAMMRLKGKIAWVTGAGSGIGEAAALALAEEGATIVLCGRTAEKLERVATRIKSAGGTTHVQAADLTHAAEAERVGAYIQKTLGRLDILVNNAGTNVQNRAWSKLTAAGASEVIQGNLASAFYCVTVALPIMRGQKDGVMIHTASLAGRNISLLGGPAYSAAKHGVVAMSHSINMEECQNGIRSTAVCPGEVVTPIFDKRPRPPTPEECARMVQPEDCGELIKYIACLPPRVCLNEVWISPTWNRGYIEAQQTRR